jgi:hypothetical protein
MLIDFYSSKKKDDWPFEVVIDLSKSPKKIKNIDDWEFDLESHSRVGRDVTKIKAENKKIEFIVENTEPNVFSIKFKSEFEADLSSLENSLDTLQVSSVYVKKPGEKKQN